MSVSYSYVLGVDFKSALQIDISAFEITIQSSSISSAVVDYLIQLGTTIFIYFNTNLSAGDLLTLNNLVASYTYISSTAGQPIDTSSTQILSNKLLSTLCYWVDNIDNTKKIGLSLSGMSTATQLTLTTSLTASRIYTIPDTGAASSFIMTHSTGTQIISTGNLTYANSSGTFALTGSSKITIANAAMSISALTGSIQSAGGAHFKNLHIAGATNSFSGVAGSLVGLLSAIDATTITVNTNSDMAFTSIQQQTLAAASIQTTANVYSLYVAGAPIAGINETITNSYALGIVSGKVLIGGTLQMTSGATNGFYLKCDVSGNASWSPISFTGSLTLTGTGSTMPTLATIYSSPASTIFSLANNYYFNYFNTPISTGSTTGTASTIFIAGAPVNATTAYALNVASGNCYIGSSTTSSSITSGALTVIGGIGCSNLYTSDINITGNFPCILNIDCNNSQTLPAQILFTNSAGTGDFMITGNGGDISWQGGGGRCLQMAAWHEICLVGGRCTGAILPFANGSNSTYNTIIFNTNNSIGLSIIGMSGQTVDLQQWQNSTGTVLSKVLSDGSLVISTTTASTSSITGALQCAGGAYFGNDVLLGSFSPLNLTSQGNTTINMSTLYSAPSSTAFSAANNYYFNYFDQPITTGATTASAYTIYVKNAPANATNPFSLYVNSGKTYLGGNLQLPIGSSLNSILKSDASGNASWTNKINENFTSTSTAIFNTTSITPINITSMILTPNVAGTYLILFTTQCVCSTNTINITLRLAFNGVAIAATNTIMTTRIINETFSVNLSAIQTFNGTTDNITAQLGSSNSLVTVSANTRFITAIRIST